MSGSYNAQGQHVLSTETMQCYGVGDCINSSRLIEASGGVRDFSDEGAHPSDVIAEEDPRVFQGTCSTGCTAGSTSLTVSATQAAGTQGEGRFLIDTTPGKTITAGSLTGGVSSNAPHPTASFTGTAFSVSTFFQAANVALPQSTNMAPGVVQMPIVTTGVPSGYQVNTAAAPAPSGIACVTDYFPGGTIGAHDYEMVNYTVVDSTHFQLTLNKPHAANATIAIGGLCGYGLEQTVDTANGIRQVFPVVGSTSPTVLFYAAGVTAIVAQQNSTSAYRNISLTIASVARSSNTVTVTTASNMPIDLNGLSLTISGVTDASYNGSFVVTSTGPSTFTYSQSGANSTSSGGAAGLLTGGYALYPMAEVVGVMNAATSTVDGTMALAPNTVAWAAGDTVEEPHYYQQYVRSEFTSIGQVTPRPSIPVQAGMSYQQNVGLGVRGWIVQNAAPATNYVGSGGTHAPPDAALQATGIWNVGLDLQAGEDSAIAVHCNSRGCGKWNSGYNLLKMDSNTGPGSVDTVTYAPQTSTLGLNLNGAAYSFTPGGFTANTINVTNLNATNVTGLPSATPSAQGAVVMPTGTTGNALGTFATQNFATPPAIGATSPNTGNFTSITTQGFSVFRNSNATAVNVGSGGNYFVTGTSDAFIGISAASARPGGLGISRGDSTVPGYLEFVTGRVTTTGWKFLMPAGATDFQLVDNVANAAKMDCISGGACTFNAGVSAATLTSSVCAVTFSATATFAGTCGNQRMALTGNVTSSTLAAGANGQRMCFNLVQDATGGRTFAWPTNVAGATTIGTTANKRNQQCFSYSTSDTAWLAESAGVQNQ